VSLSGPVGDSHVLMGFVDDHHRAAAGKAIGVPNPRRTNRPLTALATRLTLIHEEGRTGPCPRVLTDER
jgi:hypothetical protein